MREVSKTGEGRNHRFALSVVSDYGRNLKQSHPDFSNCLAAPQQMRGPGEGGVRLGRARRPHPAANVHLSHRLGQAEVTAETGLQIRIRQRKSFSLFYNYKRC